MKRSGSGNLATPVPWLCGLLVVAGFALSMHVRLETPAAIERGARALKPAIAFFRERPYLEPGPVLAPELGAESIRRARADDANRRRAAGHAAPTDGVVRLGQERLDALVAEAVAGIGPLPAADLAVLPGGGPVPAPGWWLHPLLHVSNWHLVGNAALLLFLGFYLERSFGRIAFAASAAAASAAGAAAWTLATDTPPGWGLVGATPLLAGLLAAFALRHAPRADESFYPAGLVLGALWLALPAWAGAGWSFAAVDPFAVTAAPGALPLAWACAGAVAAAVVCSGAVWLSGFDGELAGLPSTPVTRSPAFRRALRARRAGRPREALELLRALLREQPDAYEAALAVWQLERELGHAHEAAPALVRLIRLELVREDDAEAIDHWLELTRDGIPEVADPMLLIHMALRLREHHHRVEAANALRCALERSEDRASHVVAARIARAARGIDPGITEEAAWRALGSVELELRERQALESLLGEVLAIGGPKAPRAAARREPVPGERPRPIEIRERERRLDAVGAVPLRLADDGIEIQTDAGEKKLVRYRRIEAVAVAAVGGLGERPVILVDLLLDWKAADHEALRAIRLRGDRFDPRSVLPAHTSAVDALRSLLVIVLDRSRAEALPDPDSALGRPFASFDSLNLYHDVVLHVSGDVEG